MRSCRDAQWGLYYDYGQQQKWNTLLWHILFAVEVIMIGKFYANLDRFRLNKTPKSHFSNVCGCLDEKPWDDVIFGRGKKEEEEHLLKKKVS